MKLDSRDGPAANRSRGLRNALILAPVALFPLALLGVLFLFRSSSRKRAIADQAIYLAQASPKVAAQATPICGSCSKEAEARAC